MRSAPIAEPAVLGASGCSQVFMVDYPGKCHQDNSNSNHSFAGFWLEYHWFQPFIGPRGCIEPTIIQKKHLIYCGLVLVEKKHKETTRSRSILNTIFSTPTNQELILSQWHQRFAWRSRTTAVLQLLVLWPALSLGQWRSWSMIDVFKKMIHVDLMLDG